AQFMDGLYHDRLDTWFRFLCLGFFQQRNDGQILEIPPAQGDGSPLSRIWRGQLKRLQGALHQRHVFLPERDLLQSLCRQKRYASAVEQRLIFEVNERTGVVQDEQCLLLPQVQCTLFQCLQHTLQGWISEVTELEQRRTLLG